MPFDSLSVLVQSAGPNSWRLMEDVVYRGRSQTFTVPAGTSTDFATIPQMVTWFVPTTGEHTLAAVLHDWLCTEGIRSGQVSSRDADGIFRRVMRELGVPPVRRWLMWTGVRWGALVSSLRRPGTLRDLPLVLLLSLLALPLVLPATVLALPALAVYALAEGVARLVGAE